MARVYYEKKTSAKVVEGATAGLLGGLVAVAVMGLWDALTPQRSWWTSTSLVGAIFTGARDFNTASPDTASLVIGFVLSLLAFALFGVGLVYYRPIFRRFNINPLLAGVIYGAILWLLVDVFFLNPVTGGSLNLIALLVSNVFAGVIMAWWLSRQQAAGSRQ